MKQCYTFRQIWYRSRSREGGACGIAPKIWTNLAMFPSHVTVRYGYLTPLVNTTFYFMYISTNSPTSLIATCVTLLNVHFISSGNKFAKYMTFITEEY